LQNGLIRKSRQAEVVGRWRADTKSIVVETDDPELRRIADEILGTPQTIPVHGAEHLDFATQAEPVIEPPSTIKYLALFALELEARGFDLEAEEE